MGMEVVAREIVEAGEQEAAAIEKEGLQEAKAILEDARDRAEKILAERKALAERETARLRQQDLARAEFEAKKQVLVAKRGLWERLRGETLQALAELDGPDRARILDRLLENATREIPTGTVRVRDADVQLVRGHKGYTVEGGLAGIGGAVVEDPEGTVSIDLRFESLLDDLWPHVLKEENRRLFGEKTKNQ